MKPIWLIVAALIVAGCTFPTQQTSATTKADTSESTQTEPIAEEAEQPIVVPEVIPAVDTTKHNAPLAEIYFDTFRAVNRAVPLTQAEPELIEQLRDAIPPIHAPIYESVQEADWLTDEDIVVGYAAGGQAWAYPVRILNFHEIVNDVLAGEPVLISFCPLCYSGIVYSRQIDEQILTFGNTSALYESDMVMLDYETGSYWWQVAGQAIVGELTDAELRPLPSMTTTWAQWRTLHPDTLVLSRNTGHQRDYSRDPFRGYDTYVNRGQFAFPVSEASLDPRLDPGTKVIAVKQGNETRVYPLNQSEPTVIADSLDGEELVVFLEPNSATGAAFYPKINNQKLAIRVVDGQFVDAETGSIWNLAGEAISGDLAGEQLTALPTKTTFWFAIIAAEPDAIVVHDSIE